MKTYLVVTPFFPSQTSWRGVYCYDFVVALREELGKDWRVEVFVPGRGNEYEIDGVLVHRFTMTMLPSNILPFLFRRCNEKRFIKAIKRSGVAVKDVTICHGHTANFAIYPLAVKRLNPNCMTLLHHHDLMSFGLNNGLFRHCDFYNSFLARQLKRLHEAIDCHVFISRLCEKSFRMFPNVDWLGDTDYSAQARGVRLSPVKIKHSQILHNGVDTDKFSMLHDVRQNLSDFVIGCVGNFSPEKGQYDLLNALERVNIQLALQRVKKTIKVRFVGSGVDLKRCKAQALAHGIDAVFLKEMRHEALIDFYRGLDLFVLPTWLDGFGCVYAEAYACGVPFIATTRAGVEELIPEHERKLWLVEPHDVEGLASRILSFIKNRPRQILNGPISIQSLVHRFVMSLEYVHD